MGIGTRIKKAVSGFVFGASGSEAIELAAKGTDGLINGIDKLIYTDEEKADFLQGKAEIALKVSAMHIKLLETIGDENSLRSQARRRLAFMLVGVFLLLLVFSAVVWKTDPEWSKAVFDRATAMSTLVSGVVIFYFGYYGAKNIIAAVKGSKNDVS